MLGSIPTSPKFGGRARQNVVSQEVSVVHLAAQRRAHDSAALVLRGIELNMLLAVHLVDHPNPILLEMVGAALVRLPLDPVDARLEAVIAVFCAAGVQGDKEQMAQARKLIIDTFSTVPLGVTKLEAFFLGKSASTSIERLLPSLNPLPLELNYAFLRRYVPAPERPQ